MSESREFKRVNQHRRVSGICGGLAYMLNMKAWFVRVVTVIMMLLTTSGLFWIYLLVAMSAPVWVKDPFDYEEICE